MPRGVYERKKDVAAVAIADQRLKDAEKFIKQLDAEVETSKAEAKAEVKKPALEPLGPGQAYFEAPDGFIIIGDDVKDHIWDRRGNGQWINKKR